MNKVVLIGRLTRDPEVRYSQGAMATAVASFSLAVDRRFKREEEPAADFFTCTAFGKSAEFVEKYLKKGIKMVVAGRIQNDNYTNKEGQKVYSVRIIVEEMEFAESKGNSNSTNANISGNDSARPSPSQVSNDGFMNIPNDLGDEDLPFN